MPKAHNGHLAATLQKEQGKENDDEKDDKKRSDRERLPEDWEE